MAIFDGSMMQESKDSSLWVDVDNLEINEYSFIITYLINVFVRPLQYPIFGIPIMIWTEITTNYQIMRWLWFPEETLDIPETDNGTAGQRPTFGPKTKRDREGVFS